MKATGRRASNDVSPEPSDGLFRGRRVGPIGGTPVDFDVIDRPRIVRHVRSCPLQIVPVKLTRLRVVLREIDVGIDVRIIERAP